MGVPGEPAFTVGLITAIADILGRPVADLVSLIGSDALVGWAWAPGAGRQPAPGTQKQAGALVDAWVKTGAACPQ